MNFLQFTLQLGFITLRGIYTLLLYIIKQIKIFFIDKPSFIKIHAILCILNLYFLTRKGWMQYLDPFQINIVKYNYTNDFFPLFICIVGSLFSFIIYMYYKKSIFYMLDWFFIVSTSFFFMLNFLFTSRITKIEGAQFSLDFYIFGICLFLVWINKLFSIRKLNVIG